MTGTILEICISRGGLPKLPIPEGVVTPLGLEGDRHANPRFHGGPRQALLLVASEAIDALIAQGYALFNGALGENITMRGIDPAQMRAGQRYRLGQCMIELTKLRVPCKALDVYGPSIKDAVYDRQVKAGDPTSPRWAMGGFYASILRTGPIRQNDIIALVDQVV